ncbi:unnamed protein product, partial [Didymodactylos carnosus]
MRIYLNFFILDRLRLLLLRFRIYLDERAIKRFPPLLAP